MPIDDNLNNIFQLDASFLVKSFLVLFLVFYSVFALILFRQIQLMNKKLPTTLSPVLQFIGIINLGLALAILFLVIGSF